MYPVLSAFSFSTSIISSAASATSPSNTFPRYFGENILFRKNKQIINGKMHNMWKGKSLRVVASLC